ncbi:MAG: reverse transcriptase domain-containing protein [Acutalibacteraceae bacterium]
MNENSCAASDKINCWEEINSKEAEEVVKKLQRRIAKAQQAGETDKVKFLQHKLIHSFYAKALAVKIVSTNRGKKTPGVDNVIWKTPEDKFQAIFDLNRRGYKPKPLRRVYIPKFYNGKRPLSIPTMHDRAMQTLYKFALEPIAEVTGDYHSYAYRPNRSAKDAIIHCANVLYDTSHPQWILRADIKSCFDNISHEWIMEHIPIDKEILLKFIKNGYIDDGEFHSVDKGVPQGGSISTVIFNMVLDGLENGLTDKFNSNLHFVRYADDFIIIAYDKDVLEKSVIDFIKPFLAERGLQLSEEKTFVTHIDDGFDFLGFNVTRYGRHICVTPSNERIDLFIDKVTDILMFYSDAPLEYIFKKLRSEIVGWINYYNGVVDRYSLYDVEYDLCSVICELTNDIRLSSFVGYFFQSS